MKFSTPMPHSYPVSTSFASSLNRFKEAILPSWMTILSRSTRICALRAIFTFSDPVVVSVPVRVSLPAAPSLIATVRVHVIVPVSLVFAASAAGADSVGTATAVSAAAETTRSRGRA